MNEPSRSIQDEEAAPSAFATVDLPWWLRGPLAAALGAAVGMVAAFAGRNAAPTNLFLLTLPIVTAGNLVLADLGRRRFSIVATLGTGIMALALVGCLGDTGGALLCMLLGAIVGTRIAAPGKLRGTRKPVLLVLGAIVCPLAAIAAGRFVLATKPGEPIAVGLALFHALFWLPLAGSDAVLSWSAARARVRVPARDRV